MKRQKNFSLWIKGDWEGFDCLAFFIKSPLPPFLKGENWLLKKYFHHYLVLLKQHEGLSWKLSQDSMLFVTPEWFYQGSKIIEKNHRFLINAFRNDGWKTSPILKIPWKVKSKKVKCKKFKDVKSSPFSILFLWIKGDREGFDWLTVNFKSPFIPLC